MEGRVFECGALPVGFGGGIDGGWADFAECWVDAGEVDDGFAAGQGIAEGHGRES